MISFTQETLIGKEKFVRSAVVEDIEDPLKLGLTGLENLKAAIEFA
jgi:hypothetical protein